MVLSGFSLSNVATMTSNVISVNTCQLKIAHGGSREGEGQKVPYPIF